MLAANKDVKWELSPQYLAVPPKYHTHNIIAKKLSSRNGETETRSKSTMIVYTFRA